ncbi:hypothetical protein NMG60_11023789 [Bertholletia excelsa]
MRGSEKKLSQHENGKPCLTKSKPVTKQSSSLKIKIGTRKLHTKRHKPILKSNRSTAGSTVVKKKDTKSSSKTAISKRALQKAKITKKKHSANLQGKKPLFNSSKVSGRQADGVVKSEKLKKRRKRKRQRDNAEQDDASRLQRRTRYLLIKMKLEQNLIDAYSGEGWKGQSREKIKPEKELQRAKKQILKCKLGIRDAIRQLDMLSSVGCIEDSAIAPDGSVYHEHIICAKCKLREAFPDNDIILCDGTCNCAFHQKCLDPPLSTENIPPGDQGWFCKFCECKMEILEAMNAHLGTRFSADSHWQDIFKEEAALPDGGNALLDQGQDWPSDDSEDDDYDPEKIENSCTYSGAASEADDSDDASSSSGLRSLEDELVFESRRPVVYAVTDETSDCEILNGPRQRRAVDYKKLYDEMFGKDAAMNDQISEDEDWGPSKRKRREKESDAATTLMTLSESENKFIAEESKENFASSVMKRSFFRIPHNAVEKLRLVFAENELPSRAVKDDLSKQLGLDSGKVNKWFKNARYMALKARKAEEGKQIRSPKFSKDSLSKIGQEKIVDPLESKDVQSTTTVHSPKHLKELHRRKNPSTLASSLKKKQHERTFDGNKADIEFGDDVSLKLLKAFAKRRKKTVSFKYGCGIQEAEIELERLCEIKGKVEKLRKVLTGLPNFKSSEGINLSTKGRKTVVHVPVAELIEKK